MGIDRGQKAKEKQKVSYYFHKGYISCIWPRLAPIEKYSSKYASLFVNKALKSNS
jgi:hypothetical protein